MSEMNYFTEAHSKWLIQRLGRITASCCNLLFVGGKRPMTESELKEEKAAGGKRKTVDTLLGDGAMTYLCGLIDEMTTGVPVEESDFKQTEWGKANEMDAIFNFEAITGFSVDYHGISSPEFFPYGDFAGGSPDGVIITPDVDAICECKCHYDGTNHLKKLLIKSVDEFKDKFWKEYCQDQMNMKVLNKKNCYSISYDPRKKDRTLMMKIIRIPYDVDWQKEFDIRFEAALEMMSELNSKVYDNLFIK